MKIIIIGAGETGKSLANILLSEDFEVVLIEKDDEKAKETAENTTAMVLKGDGTKAEILDQAGIENAYAVIALTGDDKTNLMICEIAKTKNVISIIASVNDSGNEELFTKAGIRSVVSSVSSMVVSIRRQILIRGPGRIVAEFGGGKVQVVEILVPRSSKLIGRRPEELNNMVISTIYRKGELLIPDNKTIIEEGDVLIITLKSEHLKILNSIL